MTRLRATLAGMRCPLCGADDTRVIDSRPAEAGHAIRRRRECETCQDRFTTYERSDVAMQVRKRSGRLEPFMADKLRRGIESALADRPVSDAQRREITLSIEQSLRALGSPVGSDDVGRLVLEHLRDVDEVAYLRYASVYKEFQGARDFEREMATLEET